MAKRYYSFSDLEEILGDEISQIHKPSGTLGKHHLQIKVDEKGVLCRGVEKNRAYDEGKAKYLVGYSVKKYFPLSAFVLVKPEGALGYHCGEVWAIKPKSEMTPLQRLRAEWKISKDNVIILRQSGIKNIKIKELRSAISDNNPHANRNRFWGNGETWAYRGEYCAFTEYHSFRGGVDQRRELHKVYLLKENLNEAIAEANRAIAEYRAKSFNNIKHPANNLMFAP